MNDKVVLSAENLRKFEQYMLNVKKHHALCGIDDPTGDSGIDYGSQYAALQKAAEILDLPITYELKAK